MGTMTQREVVRKWLIGLFLGGMVCILANCEGPGGEGCGGIEDIVSCVSITSISPVDSSGEASSNVDAFQDPDCDGDETTIDPEVFSDHNATITFSNAAFPGASGSLAVTLRTVSISYRLNNCPSGTVCPPLPGFTQDGPTLVIPEDGTVTGTIPFVPLSVKMAYRDQGGDAGGFPSYTANYVFTAQTQSFSDTITIRGSAAFTIGDFNLCE